MIQLTQAQFDALPRAKDVTAAAGVQFVKEYDGTKFLYTYTESYQEQDQSTSWRLDQQEVEIIDDKKEDIQAGRTTMKQIAAYLNNKGLTAADFIQDLQSKFK